jgi:hypothetical protein
MDRCKADLDMIWEDADVARLRYYPGTCMEGLSKTTEHLNHDSRGTGWDSNWAFPKHEWRAMAFGSGVKNGRSKFLESVGTA